MLKRASTALGAFVFVVALGCANTNPVDEMPALHAVRGTVTKNGKPVSGGSIRFHQEKGQENIIVSGAVDEAGRFELLTRKGKQTAAGAPAGKYQVVYTPRITKQSFQPTVLKELVTVEPKENVITIKLDSQR